jgi:hypothetical protein
MKTPTYYDLKKMKKIVFLDDFEDGVISSKWILANPSRWTESNGRLFCYLPMVGTSDNASAIFTVDLKYKKVQMEGYMLCWCSDGYGNITVEVTDTVNSATLLNFSCTGTSREGHTRFVLKINITEKKIEGYIVTDSYPNVNVITPINVDISGWKYCYLKFGLSRSYDSWFALTLDYIAEVKEFF